MADLRSRVGTYMEEFKQNGHHSDEEILIFLKGLVNFIRTGKGELSADVDGM